MITNAYAETSAAAAPQQAPSPIMNLFPIVGMLVLFYFFLLRPQQKRAKEHKAMLGGLQKGDKVITNGGIYGTIVSVGDTTFEVMIADNVKIKILKSAVTDKAAAPASNGAGSSAAIESK